jgi:hypothetical protein
MSSVPSVAEAAVMVQSEAMPEGSEQVRGHDFDKSHDLHDVLNAMRNTGFQATNLGHALAWLRMGTPLRRRLTRTFAALPSTRSTK